MSPQFLRFAAIGAIGFVVDAAVLTAMVNGLGWGAYGARALSFGIAVTVTWYLNRRWTFADRASRRRRTEYGRYFGSQTIGALINVGVFSLCIELGPRLAAIPVLPLAIGSGVALVYNYIAAKHFAFRGQSGRKPESAA